MPVVAIDIGGTFTDLAAVDSATGELRFAKSLTTPPAFERGMADCLAQADIASNTIDMLRHGTTVVINVLLERKGARTALITRHSSRPGDFATSWKSVAAIAPKRSTFYTIAFHLLSTAYTAWKSTSAWTRAATCW
jgi:hypothetical protein